MQHCRSVCAHYDARRAQPPLQATRCKVNQSKVHSCVGYELSLIDDAYEALRADGADLEADGWTTSAFIIFVRTIPGRFYPIAMLFLQARLLTTYRLFAPTCGTTCYKCTFSTSAVARCPLHLRACCTGGRVATSVPMSRELPMPVRVMLTYV